MIRKKKLFRPGPVSDLKDFMRKFKIKLFFYLIMEIYQKYLFHFYLKLKKYNKKNIKYNKSKRKKRIKE